MAQANDLFDTIMKELNNVIVCDNEQAILEEKSISFHEETDIDAIPPSLLRYFESSQSRAEVCEKLILENAEDFLESHHTEDKINFPTELEEDIMKLKEQVDSDSETNDNKISTDMGLHATTKKLLTPSVSVCTRNEDEAVADIDMESEKPSSYEKRTPEISLDEEESLNTSGYEAEREKRCCEEVKTEEQRRQIESDFQKELDRIMEAEKLHQRELELMEKKAQEKLEQELLLQREVISNLQKQVQEERRRMEEEQKRMKEEDDKRKKEEERKVMEEQRRREEEEERGKIEEEQKRRKEEEDARKKEEERKVMEEQRRREEEEEERGKIEKEQKRLKEEEDARKKEEERKVMEEQRRREEEEERGKIEKEQKRLKEEEDARKKEEERKVMEEQRRREEEERGKIEEEQKRLKEEEDARKKEEERKVMEEQRRREEEEMRRIEKEQKRLKEEEEKRKKEEERKVIEKERRKKEEERRGIEEEDKRIKEMKDQEEEQMLKEEKGRKKKEEKQLLYLEKKKVEDEMRIRKAEERKKKEVERIKNDEEEKIRKDGKRIQEVSMVEKEDEEKVVQEKTDMNKMEEKVKRENERKITEEKQRLEDCKRKEEETEIDAEGKQKQEERKTKKIEEEKLKEEEGQKAKIMRKEERNKYLEMKSLEDMRKVKAEDDRQMKEEQERIKKEQNRRKRVEEAIKTEKEKPNNKDGIILKRKDEERKMITHKIMNEAKGKCYEEENGTQSEKLKVGYRRQQEEEEREEARKMEKKKVRKDEEESIKRKDGKGHFIEDERRKMNDGSKIKEEWKKRQRDEEDYTEEDKELKGYEPDKIKLENENKTKDSEVKQGQKKDENLVKVGRKNVETKKEEEMESKKDVNKETGEEIKLEELEDKNTRMVEKRKKPVLVEEKLQYHIIKCLNEKNPKDKWETSNSSPETIQQQYDQGRKTNPTSADERIGGENQAKEPSSGSELLPVFLPEHTEQKRLSWMKECVPWSRLSLQNKRKQKGSFQSGRGTRRAMGSSSLPPLSTDTLLQSTGCTSLKEVTTVTLEDLPGCSLSSFSQCMQLQSLTLRRCGLKSLEGINQLLQLCYIDVQENDISFVDCENMKCLRVLKLSHNNLTSIHGLTGAENLDTLELSHNSITRIAGLESLRRLQKLSLDHNQLISTKGLRDVYTLLHLTCSHNHLVRVEGLENNALLNTLDLRANSLTEPPSLNNHVLLRELHLEDNSISSLLDLNTCWLPLMQHLSVAQNRITQLPSMSDFVSLQNLDLRFNCLSELQNVCESLEGCQFLRELHLTGNPLQQENGWRSTLRKALPALRATDDQETGSATSLPAVQQVSLASGSFLAFCQAQIQQTHDLELQLCRELSKASSLLGAVKISCRHFTEALQLAEDQRFAHEYGDATVADKHKAAGQTTLEETANVGCISTEKQTETEDTEKPPVFIPRKDNIRCSYWTLEENPAAERPHDALSTVSTGLKTRLTVSEANSGSVDSSTIKEKESSSKHKVDSVSNHQDLNLQNRAAVVIQQMWRKYWQRCGNIGGSSTAERVGGGGGDGGKPESGPSFNNRSVLGQHYAATIIQAVWRGFTLRRRLTSALAAVTCMDIGEDDTFEEVDVDEFVFDEVALEKQWTPLCEDPPHRHYDESEQQLSLQASGVFLEASQHVLPPSLVLRSKQAWVDGEQLVSPELRASPESSNRSKSPASAPVLSGLTERSEKILEEWGFTHSHTALLMLKRAEKMKSKKQQQKKNPSTHLSLFRNCSYHKDPVGAQKGPAKHNRNNMKVGENEPSLQQAEKTEREKQWQLTQAVHSDNNSESVRFLPEISTDILQGGRVQLVADLGYTERQHHASGLWANSSLAARPCRENCYPGRNSLGHGRKEVPSPKRVSSAPSKKDRISFRDNPVQLSGGWGGGKKRGQVHK